MEEKNLNSDTISLNDIKERLKMQITKDQKKSLLKRTFLNIIIAISMILYLGILISGKFNIEREMFVTDLKVITISIMFIGIYIIEYAYRKDSIIYALNSFEVIIYGIMNLGIIYILKLYENKFTKAICIFALGIFIYYFCKIIYINVKNINKYKKDNNDIREIIKK